MRRSSDSDFFTQKKPPVSNFPASFLGRSSSFTRVIILCFNNFLTSPASSFRETRWQARGTSSHNNSGSLRALRSSTSCLRLSGSQSPELPHDLPPHWLLSPMSQSKNPATCCQNHNHHANFPQLLNSLKQWLPTSTADELFYTKLLTHEFTHLAKQLICEGFYFTTTSVCYPRLTLHALVVRISKHHKIAPRHPRIDGPCSTLGAPHPNRLTSPGRKPQDKGM